LQPVYRHSALRNSRSPGRFPAFGDRHRNDFRYKKAIDVIHMPVDVVSKNGTMMSRSDRMRDCFRTSGTSAFDPAHKSLRQFHYTAGKQPIACEFVTVPKLCCRRFGTSREKNEYNIRLSRVGWFELTTAVRRKRMRKRGRML
jgi:hypothetical protein